MEASRWRGWPRITKGTSPSNICKTYISETRDQFNNPLNLENTLLKLQGHVILIQFRPAKANQAQGPEMMAARAVVGHRR